MSRRSGLDIFRIMCCIGVLIYHTVDDILGDGNCCSTAMYYGASFCVPGFFLLSGYLFSQKKEISKEYCENKIKGTMLKLFAWVVFIASVHFIRTSEVYDIWNGFTHGALSRGVLPVAWFLFTYCILLILVYPLHFFQRKKNIIFNLIIIIWMIAIALGFGKTIVGSKPQSLWIHMYVGYFAVGMLLSDLEKYMEKKWLKAIKIGIAIIGLIGTSVYYTNSVLTNGGAPHQHYGTWYYTIWLVCIFTLISCIHIESNQIQTIITNMGKNTFVVYLGHLYILQCITEIKPLQDVGDAIFMVGFLFVFLNVLAVILRKLPLLRKLV